MIIIPWKNYFARKGWDTHAWAKARKIDSYSHCVSRIKKMKLSSPTRAEYELHFWSDPMMDDITGTPGFESTNPENLPPPAVVKKAAPKAKPVPKVEVPVEAPTVSSEPKQDSTDTATGTDAIIKNLKKRSPKKRQTTRKKTAKKSKK